MISSMPGTRIWNVANLVQFHVEKQNAVCIEEEDEQFCSFAKQERQD